MLSMMKPFPHMVLESFDIRSTLQFQSLFHLKIPSHRQILSWQPHPNDIRSFDHCFYQPEMYGPDRTDRRSVISTDWYWKWYQVLDELWYRRTAPSINSTLKMKIACERDFYVLRSHCYSTLFEQYTVYYNNDFENLE